MEQNEIKLFIYYNIDVIFKVMRVSKEIKVGSVKLGNGNPILIQSMCNTNTSDIESTVEQIKSLEEAGCELIRVAVPDEIAGKSLKSIKDRINIPLIADIHFDYRLALLAVENGADCIRINPGNLGGMEKTKIVTDACKSNGVAMRIGVNSGSLEKEILKSDGVNAESLCKSALYNSRMVESFGFDNFKVSMKSSSVMTTIQSYRLFAKETNYPLHVGVTEAGTLFAGTIKSSIGIGSLLADSIGDTFRVSITGDPLEEVRIAYQILASLDIRRTGVEIISCPTCGRTDINLIGLAETVEKLVSKSTSVVTIAVMGCVVNGPGEAREADYGIAGGAGVGIIFRKGEIVKKVKEDELLAYFTEILKEDNII